MTAYNVVRFRVKPGNDEAFLEVFKEMRLSPGARGGSVIKTGDRSYCMIAEWNGMDVAEVV